MHRSSACWVVEEKVKLPITTKARTLSYTNVYSWFSVVRLHDSSNLFISLVLWNGRPLVGHVLSIQTNPMRRLKALSAFWRAATACVCVQAHIVHFVFCFTLLLVFSHLVTSDSSQPHGLQHARLLCPSPSPWFTLHTAFCFNVLFSLRLSLLHLLWAFNVLLCSNQ